MTNLFLINESFTNGYRTEILSILSVLAILSGVFVIISKNPVVSVLFLIGLFASISCYLILLGLSFIGLSYLIVYIGAVKKRILDVAASVQIWLYKVILIIIQIFKIVVYSFNRCICNISHKDTVKFCSYSNMRVAANFKTRRFYSTKSSAFLSCGSEEGSEIMHSPQLEDENFLKWFTGFTDAEGNFTIVFYKDSNGNIISATFRFVIELHVDDIEALRYIKSKLNLGTEIAVYGNSCKFAVVHRKDIYKLISIFDKYNLNTIKYLDYLDFKQGFILYNEYKEKDKTVLLGQLLKLKNGMNKNRTNFNLADHKIVISDYWLLGLIEGEGSFHLEKKELRPGFVIWLTHVQLFLLEKIKDFLEDNLGFDKYSLFKLKNSSCISINTSSNGENSKPMVKLVIRNTNVLINYLIPFLDNMKFITKKGKDFEDFKIISAAVYNGTVINDIIKSLIIKLSYTMNHYRLSTNNDLKKVTGFSKDNLATIVDAKPTIMHLSDGRQVDIITRKEINRRLTNCVYEIVNKTGEAVLVSTLNETATILNVDLRTVKKHLEGSLSNTAAEIKDKRVRRVPVLNGVASKLHNTRYD